MSRSYLSLNSKSINNQRRQTNILTNAFKTNYLEVGTTTGGGGGTADGVSQTYVDGSLNNIRSNYALSSSLSDYPLTTYVDGSLNNIRTNYASKTYVDTNISNLINSAPETLNTLNEIASALQSDASFGTNVYARINSSDASINFIRNNYALTTYVDSSLNNIRTSDTTFNGNITLGNGTKSIAINKQPSASYALDISGATYITGNLSINKNPSDVSYSYFDMSNVNMNIFNVSEKFSFRTYDISSITLDYSQGSIFDISAVGANITSIAINNVPTTLNRSVMVTVMLSQAAIASSYYILPSFANRITINGTPYTYLLPNATAFTAPANARMVIHQYNILWASATPIVMASMSYMG